LPAAACDGKLAANILALERRSAGARQAVLIASSLI
jgi:hypothetical protein